MLKPVNPIAPIQKRYSHRFTKIFLYLMIVGYAIIQIMSVTPAQRREVRRSGETSPTAKRAATALPPQHAVQTNKSKYGLSYIFFKSRLSKERHSRDRLFFI